MIDRRGSKLGLSGHSVGIGVVVVVVLLTGLWSGFISTSQGALTPDQKRQKIADAVNRLKAEAEALDNFKGGVVPVFTRPHPALRGYNDDLSLSILQEMTKKIMTNEYRDVYVKWHLAVELKKMKPMDREEAGDQLVRLVKAMPGPLQVDHREPYRDLPEDIAQQWWSLWRKTRVSVGYPPFTKNYHGRDAMAHVAEGKKAEWEVMAREMERLRPLWKRVRNEENIAFNRRVNQLNIIIREYRGELIYELLKTGDPAMLSLIANEITGRVKKRQRIVFDLVAYVYLAMFDGVLNLYDQKDLEKFAREIKQAAQSAEGYEIYEGMSTLSSRRRIQRNFADYAFHLIQMLENIDVNALPKAIQSQ